MAEKRNPGALAGATGADMPCQAKAAGFHNVAQAKGRTSAAAVYRITPEVGGEPFEIEATGREAWALDQLCMAGPRGCTPIDQPAPRWSAYIHSLRGRGVPIETVTEKHGGQFAGHHGRYVLRATVRKGGTP